MAVRITYCENGLTCACFNKLRSILHTREPKRFMKKFFLSAVSLAALTGTSFAADFVPYKASTIAPTWTGFYSGLNAGYGLGTTATVRNPSWALNDNWAHWESYAARSPTGCNGKSGRERCTSFTDATYGIASIANAGISSLTQKGVIGGGQIGYNYNLSSSYVVGIEADFQGSGMQGTGSYSGHSSDGYSRASNGKHFYSYAGSRNFTGIGKNDAGLSWLGTVRGRVGYLVTPTLLIYGSGGLAYGNVWSSSKNISLCSSIATENDNGSYRFLNENYSTMSTGYKNESRVGWAAGGGFEFKLTPSWSLKSEAIYYNLGSIGYASSPLVFYGTNGMLTSSLNTTRISYEAIIARGGLNYHFNFE